MKRRTPPRDSAFGLKSSWDKGARGAGTGPTSAPGPGVTGSTGAALHACAAAATPWRGTADRGAGGAARRRIEIGLILLVSLLVWVRISAAAPGDPAWLYGSEEERRRIEEVQAMAARYEFESVGAKADLLIRDFPDSDEAHLARLSVYRSMGRMDAVLGEYTRRADRETTNPLVQLCVALGYFEARQLAPAEQGLEKVLKLRPDFVQARHFEVQIHRVKNERDTATRLAEELRAKYPDFTRARISELRYLQGSRAPESKLRALIADAKALPVPPPDVFDIEDELNEQAIWYDPATALPLLDRALQIDPSRVDLAVSRATRLAALGRMDEALRQLQAVVAEAPGYGDGRLALARVLMDLQRYQESVDLLSVGFRTVRLQERYAPMARQLRAKSFIRAGRFQEAIDELQHLIYEFGGMPIAEEGRKLLLMLYGRSPSAKVKLLENVPFLAQKGNYCGPASLSMALGYWNLAMTQDEIAKDLYTGVAGTAPQVMQEYARVKGFKTATFEGNVERWKKLIDAGIPILWLTMLQRQGGHYMVVVGYNDVTRTFYLHNPHQATVQEVSYDNLKDEWPLLPSLVRSIVVVPDSAPAAALLDELKPTTRLRLTNLVFYIATGSNLFHGLWPALLVNMLVVIAMGGVLLAMLEPLVWPRLGPLRPLIFGAPLLLTFVLNLIIAHSRFSWAVSLLMVIYLSWATIIALLLFCRAMLWITQDYFRPWELTATCTIVFAGWASRVLIDDNLWQDRLPVAVIAVGMAWLLWQRSRMARAISRARLGPAVDPWGLIAPHFWSSPASPNPGAWYAAQLIGIEALLAQGHGGRAREAIAALRAGRTRWPRTLRDLLDVLDLAAVLLTPGRGGADAGTSSGGAANAASAQARAEALAQARAIAARYRAGSAFGLIARVAIAVSEPGDATAAREATEAMRSARTWPAIPGVPRLGFLAYPHFLLRASARLLAARTEASLDAESRANSAAAGALPTLAGTPPPDAPR